MVIISEFRFSVKQYFVLFFGHSLGEFVVKMACLINVAFSALRQH